MPTEVQEIKNAYEKVAKIEILDLSETGVQKWFNAKKEYNSATEKIENRFPKSLNEQ